MTKAKGRAKPARRKAKAVRGLTKGTAPAPNYVPLFPRDAIERLIRKGCLLYGNTLFFSDGKGKYTAIVSGGLLSLECKSGGRVLYKDRIVIAQLPQEWRKRFENLRPEIPLRPKTVPAAGHKDNSPSLSPLVVKSMKVGNETKADRDASQNFRRSTHAQVHVQSRKAVDEVTLGHRPGHVGDMK